MDAHPGCCRYVEMRKGAGGVRRFRYNHAKYIVVDQSALLLGSENYAPGGHPEAGTLGNRGWEVLVYDAEPARWFAQLFAKDSDPRQPDVQNMLSSSGAVTQPGAAKPILPKTTPSAGILQANPAYAASDGQIITSPNNSLKGLLNLIQSARSSLDIEQMSFNMNWFVPGITTSATPTLSPIADALLAAARRGVRVRILLNDEFAFFNNGNQGNDPDGSEDVRTLAFMENLVQGSAQPAKTTTNRKTVEALMQVARTERLPLEARIANLRAMGVAYIHNKGVIVDRQITLISSINWTQNSITNNRETALALTSPQIAAYFGRAFDQDWNRSATQIRTIASLEALEAQVQAAIECPRDLMVFARVGNIRPREDSDPSYMTLQQAVLNGEFIRNGREKRCILLGPSNLVVELRKDPKDGSWDVDLEGFTSAMKPFTIRAEFPVSTGLAQPGTQAAAKGYLLEGNTAGGGRKRRLGPADLSLQVR
jgi:phosphatidylserine/phosphatidylglycerophosphate/cardiolipin synthase-like enzyme